MGDTSPPSDAASQTDPAAAGVSPAQDLTQPAESTADVGTETSTEASWRTLGRRVTATPVRRASLLIGSIAVIVIASVYAVTWLNEPHVDATLHPSGLQAGRIPSLMRAIGFDADVSLLRGYERYRGIEPWSFINPEGYQCLMAVDRYRTGVFNTQCVPPGTDLFVDLGAWPEFSDDYAEGLPDGSLIRFHLREAEVDVFLYPASEPDRDPRQ